MNARVPVGLALVGLLACSDRPASPDASNDVQATEAGPDAPAVVCAQECPTCQAGFVCVKQGTWSTVDPVCLKACGSAAECAPDEKCLVPNDGKPGRTAHCVSLTRPVQCRSVSPGAHCDFLGTTCLDANTLLKEVSRFGAFCGWEKIPCPAGCRNAEPGVTTAARCL